MKTLKEHNEQALNLIRGFNPITKNGYSSVKNGIECPDCGSELFDTNPNVILTSYPPKNEIHCSNCKYKGYRYL